MSDKKFNVETLKNWADLLKNSKQQTKAQHKEFDSESSLKKWAVFFKAFGICLMGLSFPAALIVLCIDAEWLWWISLIILGGGGLILLTTSFTSALIWGFADIVGNTKRAAYGTALPAEQNNDELPEL